MRCVYVIVICKYDICLVEIILPVQTSLFFWGKTSSLGKLVTSILIDLVQTWYGGNFRLQPFYDIPAVSKIQR